MKSGWVTKKLGEVCEIFDSRRVPITKKDRKNGPIPYYGATGRVDSIAEFLFDERLLLLGEDGADWSAGANSAYIIEGKSWVNNHAHVLKPCADIIYDVWLLHFLNASDLSKWVSGTTVPKLNQKNMCDIPIPIPPLAEQKRIVAKIDAAFEKIDKLKTNAEKNLANAKDLFQSALDEAMRPKEGCNFVSLTSVSEKIFAGGDKPEIIVKESTENIKIPIYSNGENNDGLYGYTQYATVVKPAVTVSARGTIGFCSIRRVPYVPIVRLISVIPNDKVLLEYLYYSLKSLKIKNTGSSIPQLTVPMIKEFHLPMRPLSEQREIVKRLDLLAEKIKILEQNYTQQIADCVEMRQAVLREAFEGRL